MKKVIQIFGGLFITAVAVLLVINIYNGSITDGLKDAATKTETTTAYPKEEYEKAVLAKPVFTYIGNPDIGETAKVVDTSYNLYEEIMVTESYEGYEKTLKEAVAEGKIRVMDIQILEYKAKENNETEMTPANAEIYKENETYTGMVSIKESGIYQIKMSGMDEHNNMVKTNFLVAVNRKGV